MEENKKISLSTFLVPFVFVAILWGVKIFEITNNINFVKYGVYPQKLENFTGIFTSAFIHADWNHLINNSLPLLVLGSAIFYFYKEVAWKVYIWIWLMSGAWLWVMARPSYHIGASTLVYGFAAFVFVSGIIRKYYKLLALTLLVTFLYGGMVWGIFPIDYQISWEGHLYGTIAGVILAFYYRNLGPQKPKFEWEEEGYEEDYSHIPWDKPIDEEISEEPKQEIRINYIYQPKKEEKDK